MRPWRFLESCALMVAVLMFAGCGGGTDQGIQGGPEPGAPGQEAAGEDDHGDHDHGDHDHGDHDAGDEHGAQSEAEKAEAQLAQLAPEDAASARQQKVCPVSDKLLGAMGPPKKVDVNGRQVWICCQGCERSLTQDPEKYLAKLDNQQ